MNQIAENRELIELRSCAASVIATYHKAVDTEDAKSAGSPGIVFLNSLSPTRAAAGDSAVFWARSLAESGYPCFRLDLPGFGDSAGDPPADLLGCINRGQLAPSACSLIEEIAHRFQLPGVIVVGLCAGAVSALYTAASSPHCCGVVLLEPYFHLPISNQQTLRREVWDKLTGRISRSVPGQKLISGWHAMRTFAQTLAGRSLPSNANHDLLESWKRISADQMPVLLLKAPSVKIKGDFDYLDHVRRLAAQNRRLTMEILEGAGHTFSNRIGRDGVRRHCLSWLERNFAHNASHTASLNQGQELAQEDMRRIQLCAQST